MVRLQESEYPFTAITPRSTQAWSGSTWSTSQIELNSILMLNQIVWNRTIYMYKNGFGIK